MENRKKIVVTGANGYIGKHVVKNLIDSGNEVIAVDPIQNEIDQRATLCNEDIFSGDKAIYEKLNRPDICIHLAWKDGFVHNSVSHMMNLSRHFEFINNMVEGGCQNISIMGSMHEIGYWEGKIDENTPCNPLSQYGVAKNALRQSILLLAKNKGVNLFWLRAFYILGDDKRNNSIFAKILAASEEGKTEFPFTSGKNQFDFITVEELANQIVAASTQGKYTGIINVCSGIPVALGTKVEDFIKENNLKIQLQYGKFPDRIYDSPVIYGDNTIIQDILAHRRA
ncbi:MAG: NAD(P)-dependent oxidoreductase [Clostridiales bacterium]|nr:NAD(P)-dependent oxidoreductase [Clostridiales bacterium]